MYHKETQGGCKIVKQNLLIPNVHRGSRVHKNRIRSNVIIATALSGTSESPVPNHQAKHSNLMHINGTLHAQFKSKYLKAPSRSPDKIIMFHINIFYVRKDEVAVRRQVIKRLLFKSRLITSEIQSYCQKKDTAYKLKHIGFN